MNKGLAMTNHAFHNGGAIQNRNQHPQYPDLSFAGWDAELLNTEVFELVQYRHIPHGNIPFHIESNLIAHFYPLHLSAPDSRVV